MDNLGVLREMAIHAYKLHGQKSRQYVVYRNWLAEKVEWAFGFDITTTLARKLTDELLMHQVKVRRGKGIYETA